MLSNLSTVFVFLTIFFCDSYCNKVTFQNVTIMTGSDSVIATSSSSTSLKNLLPSEIFYDVYVYGRIPVLWENSVADINNVRRLSFWSNELEEIRPGCFKNLTGLEQLEISHSRLTVLKEDVFEHLTVQVIWLYNNSITKIEVGAFRDLPHLETLYLMKNRIETLDEHVFDGLTTLRFLDLSINKISSLPTNIFRNLPNLWDLDLKWNNFRTIQEEVFNNLPVHYLDLSANSIPTLREGVFNRFPKDGIALWGNKLTAIPEGIFNGLLLSRVDLAQNLITYIAPKAFDDMPELEKIFLSSNQLDKYNPDWFHNSPKVYWLYLYSNLFEEIPDEAFKNIIHNDKRLRFILRENKIREISPNGFKGLKNFEILDLSSNQLENWNENILADAEVIQDLILSGNKIRCVEGDFNKIFKATDTDLRENPLSTDCRKKIDDWVAQSVLRKYRVTHS